MKTQSKALKGRQMIARGEAPGTSPIRITPFAALPREAAEHLGDPEHAPATTEHIFSFRVTVKSKPDWGQTINARTAGEAKSAYLRELHDAWPDVPYTALRCQKIGAPETSAQFLRNATYRGVPNLRCGDRVQVGISRGTVIGHDCSCNFRIQFDQDSKYRGNTLSVHPDEMEMLTK